MFHRQEQEELQLRHRAELRSKEERWEAQRLTWEESLMRSQEAEMMAKERELRTRLREDRDKVSALSPLLCCLSDHLSICCLCVCGCSGDRDGDLQAGG